MACRSLQSCHWLLKPLCHSKLAARLPAIGARHCSTGQESERRYIPRRALTYVPGSDERKLRKVPSLNADSVVLDCEDGVAMNRKEEARHTIVKMLSELPFGRTESAVRINSISSGLAEEDLKVIMAAERLPPTLLLPKVQGPEELDAFAAQLNTALANKRFPGGQLNLIIYVETAMGLLNLHTTCQRGQELSEGGADFVLDGIVFGSDDFCADIGASRTADAMELLYARQHTLVVAKAHSLQAIDLVHIDYKDLDGLRTQSLEGARMGFTGKQVIHPIQVPVVQEAFTPSPDKVEWATELIKAFEEHQETGQGAFTFRGSMIDMPSVLQARNIVQLTEAVSQS